MPKPLQPLPLDELKPKDRERVYDLVGQAGLDTSDWANYKRPNQPAANPRYCYEWAFTQPGKPVVLCLWHHEMQERDGRIFQEINYRQHELDSSQFANRNLWEQRSRRMDDAMRLAARDSLPVRVIVVDGVRRTVGGTTASKVSRRLLDPVSWSVESYDDQTGRCRLVRGLPPVKVVDQFSIDSEVHAAKKRQITGEAFDRNSAVRQRVLNRSQGQCESCGVLGFLTPKQERYLETHHIVPLSEGGADTEDNVIALCPTEHREAHHGARAAELRQRFQDVVRRRYGTLSQE